MTWRSPSSDAGPPENRSETGFTLSEGTLDEWIQQFMQLRETQRHLYEIYTVPQSDLVSAILAPAMWLNWRGSGIFLEDSAANLAGIVVA